MTRRERLENKIEKREEWAAGRAQKAGALLARNEPFRGDIAFNTQPGHIPERARVNARSDKAYEHQKMAAHHEAKAAGLAHQLDRTIFSDDPDAIEQLEEKASKLKQKRDEYKCLNAYWRKHKTMKGCPGISDATAERLDREIPESYSWQRQPVPAYRLTNMGAEIRRAEKRIEEVRDRNARTEQANASGGVLFEATSDGAYTFVTFAERPEWEIITALKDAGFSWGAGRWAGPTANLPECVKALQPAQEVA